MDAVVYIGGLITGQLAAESGETIKALINFDGKPSVLYVLEGLLNCPQIDRIAVVGAERVKLHLPRNERILFAEEGKGAIDNILIGLDLLGLRGSGEHVLTCPGDLPLLTSDSVTKMIKTFPTDAAVGVSIVPQQEIERDQPGCPYNYIRSKDGKFANTCLGIIRASMVDQFRALLEEFHESRKSQLRIVRRIGFIDICRFVSGRLSIADAEAIGQRIFGEKVFIDRGGASELALDVDAAPEYRYILSKWNQLVKKTSPKPTLTAVRAHE